MSSEREVVARHPIRVVSRRTGLSPGVLRAWEKRYGVVTPSRSEGGQRLYSDEDVHRLALLHRVVEEGRNISQVSSLSLDELEALVAEDQQERIGPPIPESLDTVSALWVLERARWAVREMDFRELERVLTRGAMAVSVPILTDEVLVPLLRSIGSSWRKGQLGLAHEHLASVVTRRFLEWLLNTVDAGEGAPVLVAATPARERHELGALLSAVSGGVEGWKCIYLGPDLPALEIGLAALRLGARVVTLSLLDPSLTNSSPEEIMALRKALPSSIRLVVGGPAEIMAEVEKKVEGVECMTALPELRASLGGASVRF